MSFPGLPIGQLVLDRFLRVIEADGPFQQLFGTVEVGSQLDDLVSDRDRRGATALASQINAYRPGSIIDLQLLLSLAGRDRYVRLRLLADGELYRVYVEPADDPTSLTHVLALIRQRWLTIFNHSEEGIAVLDEAGQLVEHNQRFLELLRLRSNHGILLANDALLGRVLADLLPVELAPVAAALQADMPDFEVSVTLGLNLLKIEGRQMREPGSNRSETFLLVRDVTQQHQIAARDNLIRADLQRAARFQRSILSRLPRIDAIQFGLLYEPFDAVGGDLYDAALLPDGRLRLFIADATGHGIEAALATILIKTEYDAIKAHGTSPGATLRELNNRIATNHRAVDAMFSCALLDLDLARNTLRYSNAGHPAPLLFRGGEVEPLEEDGAMIGIKSGLRFPEWNLDLEAWEAVILVTDGVTDVRNPAGVELGTDQLYAAIREARRRTEEISEEVLGLVQSHRGTAPAHDDMTLLAVTRSAVMHRS